MSQIRDKKAHRKHIATMNPINAKSVQLIELHAFAYCLLSVPLSESFHFLKDNIEHVVYLWGYNGQYPIAKIENATYSAVQTALSGVTPDALAKQPHPNMDQVNALRTALPKALIHTYTYRPHVGIIAETDSKNVTIHYEYDSMNRLKYIRDMYGNILKSFDYQYKH